MLTPLVGAIASVKHLEAEPSCFLAGEHTYKEIPLNLPLSYSKIEVDLSPTSKHHPNLSEKILN